MTIELLPELAADASPEFIDAAGCKEWLENLPLANVAAAQAELARQLREFNRFPVRAATRLAVLEEVRDAVNFVQIEQAKRFTNRAQPLIEAEEAVFAQTIDLWTQMRFGYLRCLDAAMAGEAGMRPHAALMAQRALAYSGLSMFHHYRAYREIPGREWHALHQAYLSAEQLDAARESVKDYLNRDVSDTSPQIAYARAILLGACNPLELSQRQLTFVTFLLERWGDKIDLVDAPFEDPEIPPLVVNVASERGAGRLDAAQSDEPAPQETRYLDARRLAKSLRNRVALLRKGESPSKLALGEDCVQPSCEQLLVYLYRQWCQPQAPRAAERRNANSAVQMTGDLAAIHYQLTGSAFRQPASDSELTAKQRAEIATFGRISTRHEDDYGEKRGYALEQWRLEDESLQGLRMTRSADAAGKRYVLGQLLAVKPADAKSFMLGQIRWLMSAESGDLQAALRLMPGLPAGVGVRPTGLNAVNEVFVQALSLTGVPALKAPPSLILPSGWYKPKRVIEVHVQSTLRAQLTALLERGSDFERVAYEVLPG